MESLIKNEIFQSVQKTHQKEMLSFREALIYLDISESLLYKLTSSRAITYYKPNGGKIYFNKSDLNDWMKQNELKAIRVLEDELNNHLKRI